ncbi:MAG: hypothetical protein M1812_004890 [Candelaria pacifica]|nr:MAG: hypothetical protein M1812_004890 [Candelaria pacifica]
MVLRLHQKRSYSEPSTERIILQRPREPQDLQAWLKIFVNSVNSAPLQPVHPVIEEFRELIEGDATLYMWFHQMFEEIPYRAPYDNDPTGEPQVRDYKHMLKLFNTIINKAPEFNTTSLVGFPINAILNWPMGTPSGVAALLNDKVNAQIRKMLNAWALYLSSKDSTYVLTTAKEGWFGEIAAENMPGFDQTFVCQPEKLHRGFESWDDFFTREFRNGKRPVAAPNDDNVIINACESAPYRVAYNVSDIARFWIKAQPYSLRYMLADDILTPLFFGGTVYQAFLSAISYHRWHSPVDGTIVKAYVQSGTYFSEALSQGFAGRSSHVKPDPVAPNRSQAYISEVATRALIFIEADNPAIGLMCFIGIGMAEVSTCDIRVHHGQKVKKGDQLGMFHYGGSSYCLLFRPDVNITFDTHGLEPSPEQTTNIHVNDYVAFVKRRSRGLS